MPGFIEHYLFEDYFDSANEFSKIYRHLSPNRELYELFCIQRWFIIKEFILAQSIERFLHIDSDVLVYSDFSKEDEYMACLEGIDFNICETSAGTSFFSNQRVVVDLCNFITAFFSDSELLDKVESAYRRGGDFMEVMNYPGTALQDMALVTSFSRAEGVKCVDTSITRSGANINTLIGYPRCWNFCNNGKMVNVVFNNRLPYGLEKSTNALVRFHVLHFQGAWKSLMPAYSTYDKDEHWTAPVLGPIELEAIHGVSAMDHLVKSSLHFVRRVAGYAVRRLKGN
jgi:hypothetical protein